MQYAELGPALACPLTGGAQSISMVVSQLLNTRDLSALAATKAPELNDLLGLALNEVLHTVTEFAGEQTEADDSSIELWVESEIIILCVKFRGRPLPEWVLANWDRAQEPAVLAPPCDAGWGWLLVREALDAVSHSWCGSQQILFLERRV